MIRNLIHNFESSLGRSTVRVYFSTVQMMMFTPTRREPDCCAAHGLPRGDVVYIDIRGATNGDGETRADELEAHGEPLASR